MVGSSPHHPCSVWFVFFTLGPCLSAPPPPETLLPDWTHPPLRTGPWLTCLDMVYGSVVTVPLQNKDCSGLSGPLPPAAWGVGRAAGGLSHAILGSPVHNLFCGLGVHSGNPHPCVVYHGSSRGPHLPGVQCGPRVDFIPKKIY